MGVAANSLSLAKSCRRSDFLSLTPPCFDPAVLFLSRNLVTAAVLFHSRNRASTPPFAFSRALLSALRFSFSRASAPRPRRSYSLGAVVLFFLHRIKFLNFCSVNRQRQAPAPDEFVTSKFPHLILRKNVVVVVVVSIPARAGMLLKLLL